QDAVLGVDLELLRPVAPRRRRREDLDDEARHDARELVALWTGPCLPALARDEGDVGLQRVSRWELEPGTRVEDASEASSLDVVPQKLIQLAPHGGVPSAGRRAHDDAAADELVV